VVLPRLRLAVGNGQPQFTTGRSLDCESGLSTLHLTEADTGF